MTHQDGVLEIPEEEEEKEVILDYWNDKNKYIGTNREIVHVEETYD